MKKVLLLLLLPYLLQAQDTESARLNIYNYEFHTFDYIKQIKQQEQSNYKVDYRPAQSMQQLEYNLNQKENIQRKKDKNEIAYYTMMTGISIGILLLLGSLSKNNN